MFYCGQQHFYDQGCGPVEILTQATIGPDDMWLNSFLLLTFFYLKLYLVMDCIEYFHVEGLPLLWRLFGKEGIVRSPSLYPSGGKKETTTLLVRPYIDFYIPPCSNGLRGIMDFLNLDCKCGGSSSYWFIRLRSASVGCTVTPTRSWVSIIR